MAKIVINPTSASKKEIPISSRVISVGRDPLNDLVLSGSMVSRRHAILEQRDEDYILRDNNSSNGTMVNGDRPKSEQALCDGDLVAIGSSRLLFQIGEAEEAPVSRRASSAEAAPASPPQKAQSGGVGAGVRCPLCGKKANSTDRFCRGCGTDLTTRKRSVICGSCGDEVGLPTDFGGNCGKALAKLPQEGQATRPHRISDPLGSPKPDEEVGSNREALAEPAVSRLPMPCRKAATGSVAVEPARFGIRLVSALVDTALLGVPLILGALLWINFYMRNALTPTLLGLVSAGYSLLSLSYYIYFCVGGA